LVCIACKRSQAHARAVTRSRRLLPSTTSREGAQTTGKRTRREASNAVARAAEADRAQKKVQEAGIREARTVGQRDRRDSASAQ